MSLSQWSPLAQRFLVSGLSIAVVVLAIYFSMNALFAPLIPFIASIVVGLALKEYYDIARVKRLQPCVKTGIALTVFYLFAIFFGMYAEYGDLLPLILLSTALLFVFVVSLYQGKEPLINSAVTLFGLSYLTIPLACMIQINYFFSIGTPQDGRWWLLYLLMITYITDSCAFFFGKIVGKSKLAPYISPQKTWEGAFGGFLTAIFVSLGFAYFSSQGQIAMHLGYTESVVLGAMLSILSQLGDLAESLLKRDAGVKDSSTIPGLGGMLDMVDSLIFSAPLLYLCIKYQIIGL